MRIKEFYYKRGFVTLEFIKKELKCRSNSLFVINSDKISLEARWLGGCSSEFRGEESPSFIRDRCPLTAGRGDSTESATEIYRLLLN